MKNLLEKVKHQNSIYKINIQDMGNVDKLTIENYEKFIRKSKASEFNL